MRSRATQKGKGIARLEWCRLACGLCILLRLRRTRVEAAELSEEVSRHGCKSSQGLCSWLRGEEASGSRCRLSDSGRGRRSCDKRRMSHQGRRRGRRRVEGGWRADRGKSHLPLRMVIQFMQVRGTWRAGQKSGWQTSGEGADKVGVRFLS